ncbi:MAG TPA: HIT domain-containing protein [Candidatus Saccharimonadales bacterium]|nr:HIT domain-containing protein [Candidatus Saccharimonadales bacterium]
MADSIFTKIIKGEIPCHKVYEDDLTLAFMDLHPIHAGHVLVIPKLQVASLWDLPDKDYEALMSTCKKVANRIKKVLEPNYVGQHVAGTEVPHVHVHLFPFSTGEDFWDKPSTAEPDHAALTTIAEKLAF